MKNWDPLKPSFNDGFPREHSPAVFVLTVGERARLGETYTVELVGLKTALIA